MEVAAYIMIVKSYFTKGSTIKTAWQGLSKIKLSATKVKGFQCKAIATKNSVLDIAGVPDPPLIAIFGRKIFDLTQGTVISFNLIAIYGRSHLYSQGYSLHQGWPSIKLLSSKLNSGNKEQFLVEINLRKTNQLTVFLHNPHKGTISRAILKIERNKQIHCCHNMKTLYFQQTLL